MSKIRVDQVETLDGLQTVDVSTIVDANTLITTSTGTETLTTALDARLSGGSSTVTATGANTARALADQLGKILTLRDFGAVGDGTTDDSAAIQAALDSGHFLLSGERLTYKVNSALTLDSNTHLSDATFDFTGGPVDAHLFTASGTETSNTLTATANAGDTTLAVTDGTVFSVDDYVLVRSNELWETQTSSTISEMARVKSISTNTLTLYSPILYDYGTGDAAACVKIEPKENITLNRITALGGGSGLTHRGILFDRCLNASIEGCKFEDFEVASIRMQRCIKSSVDKTTSSRNSAAGTGYAVSIFDGSSWINVTNCYFDDCRHGVTVGGVNGVNRYITVQGCHIYGGRDSGLDSHPAGDYIIFDGNHSEQIAGQDGIVMQGANSIVSNNTVMGATRHGIFVQLESASESFSSSVTGNIVSHPTGAGTSAILLLQQGAATVVDCVISNNIVRDEWVNAIRVNAISSNINRIAVTGNACNRPSGAGILFSTSAGATIWYGSITGNTVRGLAEQIYLSAAASPDIQYISVTANGCQGGTYGVRGSNTNRIATSANILTGASVSTIAVDGAQSVGSGNVVS